MVDGGDDRSSAPRVVLVDDDRETRVLVHREITRVLPSARIIDVTSAAQLDALLSSRGFDAIVTDYHIGWIDGIEVLRRAKAIAPDCPVVMFTGTGDEEIAVEAMKRGLDDYILKRPIPSPRLGIALERALALASERRHQRRVEEATRDALRETQAITDSLIENANVLVVGLDSSQRVVLFNRTAEDVTGWTRDEIRTRSWIEHFVPPDRAESVAKVLQHVHETAETSTLEYPVVSKGGQEREIVWRSSILRRAGAEAGTISFGMDVTETRRMERQSQQAMRMETVGRFAAGLAHEFNNVLTIVMSHATHLEGELSASPASHRRIRAIQTAADRAASLTRQILAFTRQQVVQRRVIDLAQLVSAMEGMLRRIVPEDVSMRTTIGGGTTRVFADPAQIEQVLVDLVLNARDAMPSGGNLQIEVKNVELDALSGRSWPTEVPTGPYVLMSVSDTGRGMDPEMQDRIFEPFFTTKPDGRSMGLGLATVFGIVKQNEGFVWVYSEPGQGSTFKVYLPSVVVATTPVATDVPNRPRSLRAGSETLLVAEDDPGLLEITREVLEENGYTVLAASGGEEALRLAEEHTGAIDLLLSDLVMGTMGGQALAHRLSTSRPQLRVLFMSGYTANSLRQETCGEDLPVLEKPFHSESLLRRVREVLDAPALRRS